MGRGMWGVGRGLRRDGGGVGGLRWREGDMRWRCEGWEVKGGMGYGHLGS